MSEVDKVKKLYVDMSQIHGDIRPDDFVITVGKKQSNTVYHVVESVPKQRSNGIIRYHLRVMVSDLLTATKRSKEQQIITMQWYPRTKKTKNEQGNNRN